jgi:hypothetical protein
MDANLLRIDPTTQTVVMDVSLKKTPYWNYNGAKLRARSEGSQIQQKSVCPKDSLLLCPGRSCHSVERPKAEVSKFIDPDFLVLKKVPFVICSHEHEAANS